MSLTLILVRHGETAWNRQHRFQGQAGPPLSRAGLIQARHLAARLARWPVVGVYCSDLVRARQTALALAAPHGLPVRVDPRWRELSFGDWEGLTWSEIAARDGAAVQAWRRDPERRSPPGGESLQALRARIGPAVADLPAAGVYLVVTHGGPLRLFLGRKLPPAGWAVVTNPSTCIEQSRPLY